ncbi:rod shape-determining protein RodA [Candidatus Saganbacteria bacterium]|nr:rod shape-determining protein RodA [Candidatus Saganbacteria bacterium]
MINLRMLKVSDFWLWGALVGLLCFSLLAIFSSTFSAQLKIHGAALLYVKRQFGALLVGLLCLSGLAYLDYQHLKKAAPLLYLLMILMLAAVIFAGAAGMGAQRWFQIGSLSFQPSELAKIILIIGLAAFFSERSKLENGLDTAALLMMVGIPFLLIFKQPDLGTALVFLVILIGMLAYSWASPKLLILIVTPLISIVLRPLFGVWLIYLLTMALILFLTRATIWDWLLILGLNIVVGVAVPFIWVLLKPYQQQRLITFLNPGADPYGTGYHSLQSQIAIGSGGLWGKGFLHGTQTQLQFIPEQHSDFIFSAIGEEFGLIGAGFVLSLLMVMVWRAFVIAAEAENIFGSLLAAGIGAMTSFHTIANVGMTVGLLPVVGIPLPFISYGGTSLVLNMMALGILQSIYMRRKKILF